MEFSVSEKLWLLCELEAYGGHPSFSIFDSEEVIGQPLKTNMHTGKTVKIRKGKMTVQGKIIIISDDKEFLERELKHCIKNHTVNQLVLGSEESPSKMKRRRTINDAPPQIITQHQQISWLPHIQHQRERILTPSSSLQSLNSITTTTTPPMTFDQQTQTDKKWSDDDNIDATNFIKLFKTLETILDNQRNSQNETIDLKRIVIDLSKQVQTLTTNFQELSGKVSNQICTKIEHQSSSMLQNDSESHLNESASYKIDDAEIIYNDSNGHIVSNSGDEVIFTFENEDTNLSNSNNTSVSFTESINNSNSTKAQVIKIEKVTEKTLENYKAKKVLKSLNLNNTLSNSLNTSRSSLNNSRILNGSTTSLASNIINEWKDDSLNEDFVIIGNNGTKVPKHVISKVNWISHTNATRGLLMSLFSRETLSTHSLTGKPSPAFMDRKKPAKEQLDAKIVADIIQFVTTKCNVPESVVRNAITTKCADENKMSRQKRNSMLKVVEHDFNKENTATNYNDSI